MGTDCPKISSTENMLWETLKVFHFAVHNLALLTYNYLFSFKDLDNGQGRCMYCIFLLTHFKEIN